MPAQVIAASRRAATARENGSSPPKGKAGQTQSPRVWALSPWVVFAGALGFFSAIVAVYWNASLAHYNDARYYVSMAEHPFRFTTSPWGFRILTPMLVWLIHVPSVYGFAAVNVISLATTAALLYVYLLDFYAPRVALFGLALFAVSPAVLIEMKWVVDVDAFFFAMVMLAFLALSRRQWRLLGVALVLGVLDKETMLFVILPLVVVGYIEYGFEPARRWVALVGLPILAYVLLHYTPIVFRPIPGSYGYLTLANLRFVLHEQQQLAGGGAWYSFFWSMVDTFGALWILAILMLRNADRRLRHTAVFLVPVIGSVFLADNWSRVLALGFVVVIPLVCAAGLNRPFPAAVLLLTYDAMVSLGVKNLSGHAAYPAEIPLLVAAVWAAIALARPQVEPRVVSIAGNGAPTSLARADTATSNGARQERVALSNGASQERVALSNASARVARDTWREPRLAPAASTVVVPAMSTASTSPTTGPADPFNPSRTSSPMSPRIAALANGSPARSETRTPAQPPRTPAQPPRTPAPAARTPAQPPRTPAPAARTPAPAASSSPAPIAARPTAAPSTRITPQSSPPPQVERKAAAAQAPRPPVPPTRPRSPQAPLVREAKPAQWGDRGRQAIRRAPPPPAPAPTPIAPGSRITPTRVPTPAPSRPVRPSRATRASSPPRAAPSAPARPGPPSVRVPRSEAVVHLEAAQSLLADVQRLVEAAAVKDVKDGSAPAGR